MIETTFKDVMERPNIKELIGPDGCNFLILAVIKERGDVAVIREKFLTIFGTYALTSMFGTQEQDGRNTCFIIVRNSFSLKSYEHMLHYLDSLECVKGVSIMHRDQFEEIFEEKIDMNKVH